MLNLFRTLFVCLFSLYSCQARNDDAFELVSRLLCACLWLLISADKCCSFCTPFPAEVHPRRHFYVQTCFSMCIVLGACLLLCLWASSWHPLFYESILLPVFIVAFFLRSTWLRLMCFMLHAPWSLPQAPVYPVYARICCVFVCFCLLLIYGLVISLLCGIFCLLSTSHQRFVAVIKL